MSNLIKNEDKITSDKGKPIFETRQHTVKIQINEINQKKEENEYYNKYVDELIDELEITNPSILSKIKYSINRILTSENKYETLRQLFNQNNILVDLTIVNNFNFLIKDYIYKFIYQLKIKYDEIEVKNELAKFDENKELNKKISIEKIGKENIKIINQILNIKCEEAGNLIFANNPEIFKELLEELKIKKLKISGFYNYVLKNGKYNNLEDFKKLEKFRTDFIEMIYLAYFTENSKDFAKKYINGLKYKYIIPDVSIFDNKKDANLNSIENFANIMLFLLKKENNINILDSIKNEKILKELETYISLKIVKIAKNISKENKIPFSKIIKDYLSKKWYLNKKFINNEEKFIKNFYKSKENNLELQETIEEIVENIEKTVCYCDINHTISLYYGLE